MPAPSGIDYPTPRPIATRLRSVLAFGALVAIAGIIALILWGIQERTTASAATASKAYTPATATAQEIASKAAKRSAAAPPVPQQQWQAAAPPAPAVATRQVAQVVQQPPTPPVITEVEKAKEAAIAAEQKALEAPSTPAGWKMATTPAVATKDEQDEKEDFLHRLPKRTTLSAMREPSKTKYEIKTGWLIPATLETTMDSDLPGELTAIVRSNIYDTASGHYLLIPQGSRLFGEYSSRVSYGQRGAQAIWYRIIFPDASTLNLERMQGHDGQGRAGFRDKVDNHYKRLISTAILTSAFMAGGALAQNRRGSVLGYPSAAEVASSSAATNMQQEGLEITRRDLNVQPTIVVRSGYRFDVMVNRDMVFDGPYQPMQPKERVVW